MRECLSERVRTLGWSREGIRLDVVRLQELLKLLARGGEIVAIALLAEELEGMLAGVGRWSLASGHRYNVHLIVAPDALDSVRELVGVAETRDFRVLRNDEERFERNMILRFDEKCGSAQNSEQHGPGAWPLRYGLGSQDQI